MSRVKAVELVAFGVACDGLGCEVLIPTRNGESKPPGFHIPVVERVRDTNRGDRRLTLDRRRDLFFHDKDCMINTLSRMSSLFPFDLTETERV